MPAASRRGMLSKRGYPDGNGSTDMSDPLETGDIYFFYRIRMDVGQPAGLDDVQRLFMVLVPDPGERARLFIVGRKQMPEIRHGERDARERDWLLDYVVDAPRDIGRTLHPVAYATDRQGERNTGEAVPAGAGRYAVVHLGDASHLAYRLGAPGKPGKAQKVLGIRQEGSYVIAVRNPKVGVKGFPEETPDYPRELAEMFADERWIDVSDPALLDYENAQLVLIGALESLASLDVDLGGSADPFHTLGLEESAWATAALRQGDLAAPTFEPDPITPPTDRSKGGRRGGRAAAATDSAAGVTAALKGIDLPRRRGGLVRHARANDAPAEVIELLEALEDREFRDMADVTRALGKVR